MIAMQPVRHVLGLSGGRDSAALAVYMRQHHPDLCIEYFFTDTGKIIIGFFNIPANVGS